MKILHTTLSAGALIALTTATALAQQSNAQPAATAGRNVRNILTEFGTVVDLSIGILVTLALAVFFYGLIRYIFKLGGEKGADEGKQVMIWGVIALFVMVSVWGLVGFIQSFFGISSEGVRTNILQPDRVTNSR